MVAAYVIGYGVTHSFLKRNRQLRFATGAHDTGVIVSWNTEAPGLTIKNPVVNPGSIAINPITWTRSPRRATAAQSMGSFLPNAAGRFVKVSHYADARVDKALGALIVCSTCSVSLYAPGKPGGFPRGIFHTHDYPFYYYNIRNNAAERIRRYLAAPSAQPGREQPQRRLSVIAPGAQRARYPPDCARGPGGGGCDRSPWTEYHSMRSSTSCGTRSV